MSNPIVSQAMTKPSALNDGSGAATSPTAAPYLKDAEPKANHGRPEREEEQQPRADRVWIGVRPQPYPGKQDDGQKRGPADQSDDRSDPEKPIAPVLFHLPPRREPNVRAIDPAPKHDERTVRLERSEAESKDIHRNHLQAGSIMPRHEVASSWTNA